MAATKIRSCDKGTPFATAIIAGRKVGPAIATDAQAMAMFCEDIMPLMVGAFSPRLVWEGAQKAGLTTLQLHELCHRKDFAALDDLQFS
jgi:hypothetical protein